MNMGLFFESKSVEAPAAVTVFINFLLSMIAPFVKNLSQGEEEDGAYYLTSDGNFQL